MPDGVVDVGTDDGQDQTPTGQKNVSDVLGTCRSRSCKLQLVTESNGRRLYMQCNLSDPDQVVYGTSRSLLHLTKQSAK
ncbi:hypothetical protein M378DRAFT_167675 [Amanita muscaria Koide BX008]|uniref:Uncharacterized protein n=1 Tax=Amanita muscaria (strain Koide BX008) TaxID=946122 RepID=A0A0C2WWW7_AMAMK|nr:hypothetical protein M378DRAFT_167675 [Amanita muscaria Koide BX008]